MSAEVTVAQALAEAQAALLSAHPEAVLVGTDVGAWGGPYQATLGLWERFGAARFIEGPPNGPALVGVARGLADAGAFPLIEAPVGQELETVLAFTRAWRGGGRALLRVPCDDAGAAALLWGQGGARVAVVGRPEDARAWVLGAARAAEATVLFEPRALYRGRGALAADRETAGPTHGVRVVEPGRELTLVAWGAGLLAALEARAALVRGGIEAAVLDLRRLIPLDVSGVAQSLRATGRALIVGEATVGALIADALTGAAFLSLEAPVTVVRPARGALWSEAVVAAARAALDY